MTIHRIEGPKTVAVRVNEPLCADVAIAIGEAIRRASCSVA
jgi:hypothetical protein